MNKKQRMKNRETYQRLMAQLEAAGKVKYSICPECGNSGPHFVPPSFGEAGFFTCTGRVEKE